MKSRDALYFIITKLAICGNHSRVGREKEVLFKLRDKEETINGHTGIAAVVIRVACCRVDLI